MRGRWIGVALALTGTAAPAADLSPARWPAAERARLEQMEQRFFPAATRTLQGRTQMVSATLSPFAVHAGMEALDQGGTAADAAVTVALTQVATDLGAVVSYAGVAELVYYEAKTRRTYVLEANWGTYADERAPLTIPAEDLSEVTGGPSTASAGPQGRKTLVPGFMAGMAAAHARFGRLPWANLFQPAIWCAENGVTVSPLLGAYFGMTGGQLARTEEGRRFLGQSGRSLPRAGDRFVQPQLAALLHAVADKGADEMYRGAWARQYVDIVRREGGAVTLEDLAAYRPVWETPDSVAFGDAAVMGPSRAARGPAAIYAALASLDRDKATGPYWTDPDTFAAYARALQPAATQAGHHSDAVVVVDRWGNVAALVHTINATMWGETGIVVGGVPISGAGGLYKPMMAGLAPRAHVPSDMAPVLALRGGKPVLAVASVGSSLAQETTRMTAGLLGGGEPQAWAAAPPLLLALSAAERDAIGVPAGAYDAAFRAALAARGVRLREEPMQRALALRGTVAFAVRAADGWRTAEVPTTTVFADSR
ncbi:gamma-glutamyltransferase [Phenylobacterium sp.]|jgi:gamma-glutamyltranspeptidase/glutathione hydrolase|uniref:gamma-glutamyltransferase n=1 Tax=Phenylobacterium sp. TaxID=1871053 RepID=UPI002F409984